MSGDAADPDGPSLDGSEAVDVAVVGGGPAGAAAAVFTARYGLDTVVFDRGPASLERCAYLENYPGFPGGVRIGTFYDLLHDHVRHLGGSIVEEHVEALERPAEDADFRVRTGSDRELAADYVIGATRYDADYLRPLVDEATAFETHDHGDGAHEHFDREYADADGTTPVDGLYVASPSTAADRQAVIAAGRGARVGLEVVEAVRRDAGLPEGIAAHYDWLRHEAELDEERAARDTWRAYFDEHLPADHDVEADRLDRLREREIDRRLAAYVDADEVDRRAERGRNGLIEHLPDDALLDGVADEAILERARQLAPDAEFGTDADTGAGGD